MPGFALGNVQKNLSFPKGPSNPERGRREGRSRFDARSVRFVREREHRWHPFDQDRVFQHSQVAFVLKTETLPEHAGENHDLITTIGSHATEKLMTWWVLVIFHKPKASPFDRNGRKKTTAKHLLCLALTYSLTLTHHFGFNRISN